MKNLLCVLSLFAATPAVAGYGDFGLGLAIGSPSGIHGKQFLGTGNAWDFTLGLGVLDDNALSGHVDYLWQRNLSQLGGNPLDVHYGVGAAVAVFKKHTFIAGRIPLGLDLVFKGSKIDIFLEAALLVGSSNGLHTGGDGSLGARYWF